MAILTERTKELIHKYPDILNEYLDGWIKEYHRKKDNGKTDIETFELFFTQYHKLSGLKKTDKEPAFKYWKKLTLKEQRKAYKNILPFIKSQESGYVKKCRTYLADKNFEDEFETIKANTVKKSYVILYE